MSIAPGTETTLSGSAENEVIVVGVDGSPPSVHALIWAMLLAVQRDWTVEVVTAWPDADSVWVHEVPGHFCEPRAQARLAQEGAIRSALAVLEVVPNVRTRLPNERPEDALVSASSRADLLVVGSHGHRAAGRRARVGDACASSAHCPVVIVEQDSTEEQPRVHLPSGVERSPA